MIFWVKSIGKTQLCGTHSSHSTPQDSQVQVIPADLEAFDPEYFSNLKWSGWTQPVGEFSNGGWVTNHGTHGWGIEWNSFEKSCFGQNWFETAKHLLVMWSFKIICINTLVICISVYTNKFHNNVITIHKFQTVFCSPGNHLRYVKSCQSILTMDYDHLIYSTYYLLLHVILYHNYCKNKIYMDFEYNYIY